jgi:hypothetical protein
MTLEPPNTKSDQPTLDEEASQHKTTDEEAMFEKNFSVVARFMN